MDLFDLRLWSDFVLAGGDPSQPAWIDQVVVDSRRIDSKLALFVPLIGQVCDGHRFVRHAAELSARYALVRLDWEAPSDLPPIHLLRVKDPLRAFQAIAKRYRQSQKAKVVAIVGSYGKTMVKDLLKTMVETTTCVAASPESFNSQIGVALSLLTITHEHEIALIEAGISKKEEMDVLVDIIAPDYAILTHIGKKHLGTLGDLETVAEEIQKLLKTVPKEHWLLLPHTSLMEAYLPTFQAVCCFWNELSELLPHVKSMAVERCAKMPYRIDFPDGSEYTSHITSGYYYFIDLLNIAVKAAWLLAIPSLKICEILRHYVPEPTRTEIWHSSIGTTFINDAYCSDPQSIDRALKYFDEVPPPGRRVFVFGGMRNHQKHVKNDYRYVGERMSRFKIDRLLLVGNHPFEELIQAVKTRSPKTEISLHPDSRQAMDQMRGWVDQGDTVLVKGEKKESLDALIECFNDSVCNNQCVINLAAIESNMTTLRNKLELGTRVMVIVKALAYGTNDVRISKFLGLCGVDILGVSYVDEGVALKRAGIIQSVFVINAAIYEAVKAVKWDLEVGVSEKGLIEALAYEAAQQHKIVKVHLHIDTGMSRFGCRSEEALDLAMLILNYPSLRLEGVMTHFACADTAADDAFTFSQVRCFDDAVKVLKKAGIMIPWVHASNSSGVLRFHFPQYNMVRVGLAVYGLYASEDARKECIRQGRELRLAFSLVSRIVGINLCREGETISYGRHYTVSREKQRIAVVPIGYFDGLHRNYSGKGEVIIRGQRVPMVGNICMDFMMIDITDIPNASIGDSVLIFGEDEHGQYLSPEDLAACGGSIVHELITCLGPRIQRIFIHEEMQSLR